MSPRLKRPTLATRSTAIDGITPNVLLIGAGIVADARTTSNQSPLRTTPSDTLATGLSPRAAYPSRDRAATRVISSVVGLRKSLDGNTEDRRATGPGSSSR
jgi:hypothetical protein